MDDKEMREVLRKNLEIALRKNLEIELAESNYLRKQVNELKLENEKLNNELKDLKGEEESGYYFVLPYMPDNIYHGKSLTEAITAANATTELKGKVFCVAKFLGCTSISSSYVLYS